MFFDISMEKSNKELVDFISYINENGKSIFYKKGDIIIYENDYSNVFFFVKSGVLKSYKWIKEREYILGFTFAGDLDCNPMALLKKSKSSYSIAAITDCEVMKFSVEDFINRYKNKEQLENVINHMLVEYIQVLESRMFDSISLTAEERYGKLFTDQPILLRQIPLTYIASFLGITKERLSRIRKKYRIDLGQNY